MIYVVHDEQICRSWDTSRVAMASEGALGTAAFPILKYRLTKSQHSSRLDVFSASHVRDVDGSISIL